MTQPAAVTRYKKKNIKPCRFDLNRNTDADLIEWYEKQPNKQAWIKQLIRADMEARS